MMYIPDPPGPPSITGYTSGQVVRTNDTLHLTCTSRGGNPLGTVVWYRDNERVDSSFTSGGNQAVNEYIFTAMSVDNSMEYRCEVNNLVTSAPLTASVTLTVHCKCLSNIEFSDITWLIIGHTYATYSHLLLGKPPLVCPWCSKMFAVVHVLITYPGLQSICQSLQQAWPLFSLLRSIPLASMFSFLKWVGLYPQI